MDKKYCKIFSLELNESYESIDSKLRESNFCLKNNYYILDIYMASKNSLKSNVKNINELSDYLIIRDNNNDKKELILFDDGIFKGEVKGIFSTKEIIEKLDYLELFNINQEVYIYNNGDINLKIVNIRNLGNFLEYTLEDDIIKIKETLNDLNIEYSTYDNNYIDMAFTRYIERKNL